MIQSVIVFLILVYSALASGNQILRFLKMQFDSGLEELVFSYAFGLIILSELVLGLGIFGALDKKWLWAGVGLCAVTGIFRIPHILECLLQREEKETDGRLSACLEIVFLLILLVIGLWSLVPPFDTDALAYHLSTPDAFLRLKKVEFITDDVNSLFPFFTEMLFLLGVALKNVTIAQLLHWSIGVLAGFSLVAFFTRFFVSRLWGMISAIFLILTPGIFNQMHLALVDVSWAVYGFLSFYALIVGILEREKGWLFLGFILLGATVGVKYLAGFSVIATAFVFFLFCIREKWQLFRILRWSILGVGIMLLVSGYWYLKAFIVHGNPFYPYFNSLFGLGTFYTSSAHAVEQYAHKVGMGKSLLDFLKFPVTLTLFPARYDSWGEQLGAAYLVFLPFMGYGHWRGVRSIVGLYALVFTLVWFCIAQVSRFFYPCLPFLIILIARGLQFFYQKANRPAAIFVAIVLTAVFAINSSLLAYHTRESLTYLSGREKEFEFLGKRERSYKMAKFVNDNLPSDAKILNAEEVRMFYFQRNMVRESGYCLRIKCERFEQINEALDYLKQDGFTHILITQFGFDENRKGIHKWIGMEEANDRLRRLYVSDFRERDGRVDKYILYQIV